MGKQERRKYPNYVFALYNSASLSFGARVGSIFSNIPLSKQGASFSNFGTVRDTTQ